MTDPVERCACGRELAPCAYCGEPTCELCSYCPAPGLDGTSRMRVFGDGWAVHWDSDRLPRAPALLCLGCDTPIGPGDSGVIMPWDADGLALCAWHRACLRRIMGVP